MILLGYIKKNYNKIFYNFPTVSHIALYPTNVHYYCPTPNEKFLFPLHVWGPREVKKHAKKHTIPFPPKHSYISVDSPTSFHRDCSHLTWEAWTRHRRCRTRVRRGGMRRRAGDAAARASGRVRPRGSHVVFTDARRREPIRA